MPRKDKGEKLDLRAYTTPVAKRDKRVRKPSSGSRKVRQVQDPEGGQGESQGKKDSRETFWSQPTYVRYAGLEAVALEKEAQRRSRAEREMIDAFVTGYGWTLGFLGAWATFMALWVGGAVLLFTDWETRKTFRKNNPDQ